MEKYVIFEVAEKKAKTEVYDVRAKSDRAYLGSIYWHPPWRQYIFESDYDKIWSRGCLKQVMDFLNKLMEARKK